ncbi:hypothetical protein B0H67DRAFT_588371 [Lasiosphaeris hirsuta]|uniref:Uncharacterized protein n=1 Tax=Lasiosphaeris hirsuta TaxID=260670 RepID=A0AA40A1U5_9PEZI|nr:hypothetical protein B0H67DRAFT_588371 [Lasiosphaeris hirsuta]
MCRGRAWKVKNLTVFQGESPRQGPQGPQQKSTKQPRSQQPRCPGHYTPALRYRGSGVKFRPQLPASGRAR